MSVTRRRVTPDLPPQAQCSGCKWAHGPSIVTPGLAHEHVEKTKHTVRVWRSLSHLYDYEEAPEDSDVATVRHLGAAT